MTAPDNLTARLASITGTAFVQGAPAVTVDGAAARVAVAPGSAEEAASVLATAQQAGAAVAPWGGGTGQRIGAPPSRLDIILQTERLRGVRDWEPADLTAGLLAGTPLAEAQRAFAAEGQQLAIDAPAAERASVGGLVATNTSGPRRWAYGSWRDLVIGMTLALPDGTVVNSGGRVVKNVQGYDLAKLSTGALGTLGLITRVNVRLIPLPAVRRLVVARGPLASVLPFLGDVAQSQARVATLDLLDPAAAAHIGLPGDGSAGLVLLEGARTTVAAQTDALARLAASAGAHCETVEGAAIDPLWQAWVDLGRTDDLGPEEALLTVSTRPELVAKVAETLEATRVQFNLAGRWWARAGNGLVYARLGAPAHSDAATNSALTVLPVVQRALLAHWPATTFVAGDPQLDGAAQPWGAAPEGLSVMRALKQRFDPAGVLNPGRHVVSDEVRVTSDE